MKKIYILFLSVGLILSSCSDFLDKDPSTSLPPDEAVTNLKELGNAVNGAYYAHTGDLYYNSVTWVQGNYAGDFTIYADLLGGDFEPKASNNQIAPVGRYTVDPSHSITSNFYFIFYRTLAQVNSVLSMIDNITDKDNDIDLFNDYKGQLLALRALQHFDLARLYAKLPTTAADMNAANSGIVISDDVYPSNYKGTRSTLQQTYDHILKDLETALPLLSKTKTLSSAKGYITYWGAKSIQARVYLYLGKNTEALAAAKEVIEKGPYKLYTIAEYPQVWTQEATSESIFEWAITSTYNAQRNSVGYYTMPQSPNSGIVGGYGECGVTQNFVDFLQSRPDDIRSKMIYFNKKEQRPDGTAVGDDKYYPTKYTGRDGEVYVNNPKIIRLSEVYLIAAEADIKLNGESSAYGVKLINDLRRNRITGYTDVASVSIDDVLTERRLELYTEGHNAWDYWRNKKSVNNTTAQEVNYDDKRTILPIPQREISMNPDLVQNPQ